MPDFDRLYKRQYFGTTKERDCTFGGARCIMDGNGVWVNHTLQAKRSFFRYGVWVNSIYGGGLGLGEVGANDFIVALGHHTEKTREDRDYDAGIFMHELGHTLGLRHGGGDAVNFKPNYLSIMNYAYVSKYRTAGHPDAYRLD